MKIAIIIPNFNYAEWLIKSITSVTSQTYQNTEIIFVDDCSTDDSVNVAKILLRKQDKVVELKQKRYNGGARNEAYLYLSDDVDYVMFLDSDDWLYNNEIIEKINEGLNKYNFPDVLVLGIEKNKNGVVELRHTPNYKDKYDYMKRGLTGASTKIIKKELATRQECLFNEGTLHEDKNHHMKICYYMKSFANLPLITYFWNRNNKKSVSTLRDKAIWGTSPYRNYADCLQFYIQHKGKDKKADEIIEARIKRIKSYIDKGSDNQY